MKFAIKPNRKRGKDIINLLKNLGGINKYNWSGDSFGNFSKFGYFIKNEYIQFDLIPNDYKVYTLEEFEKEFPFKIGDTAYFDNHPFVIEGITEHEGNPAYRGYIVKLGPAIIETTVLTKMKKERNITLTLDKAKEWYKKGGELREIALQAYSEKELNPLPRSWEEFCKQGNPIASWRYNIPIKYQVLYKLELLRDCWRQGWKPSEYNSGYAIFKYPSKYIVTSFSFESFLSFPTEEMAEEFLNCFEDLIKQAGDLI